MGLPPVSSLASVLRDRGYEATAIHWYNGVYYNRYHNLRMLGFDSFFTLDTTVTPFEKKGMFVSDESTTAPFCISFRKQKGATSSSA